MAMQQNLRAWSLLIILSLIWGSSFILIKKGLDELAPMQVGALRIASAGVALLPWAFYHMRGIQKKHWIFIASSGLLGSLIPSVLFAFAQTHLASGVTGMLNALTPLFTGLVGWLVYSQPLSRRTLIGLCMGLAGVAILIFSEAEGELAINLYAGLVLLASTMYAVNINLIKYHLQGLSSMAITSASLLIATPAALTYLCLFTDFIKQSLLSPEVRYSAFYVLLLGVVGTAIALLIFNRLVSMTTPVFTSSVTYIIPIVAMIWGLLDGEVMTFYHLIGLGIILGGVYLGNTMQKQSQE